MRRHDEPEVEYKLIPVERKQLIRKVVIHPASPSSSNAELRRVSRPGPFRKLGQKILMNTANPDVLLRDFCRRDRRCQDGSSNSANEQNNYADERGPTGTETGAADQQAHTSQCTAPANDQPEFASGAMFFTETHVKDRLLAYNQDNDQQNQKVAKQQQVVGGMLPVKNAFEPMAIGGRVAFDAPIRKGGFGNRDKPFAHPPEVAVVWEAGAFCEPLKKSRFALSADPGTVQLDHLICWKCSAALHTNGDGLCSRL